MKLKKTPSVLMTGTAVGLIVGLVYVSKDLIASFNYIKGNRCIQYRMIRLIAHGFQNSLIKWIELTIIVSLAFFIIWLLWKVLSQKLLGCRIKHKIEFKILRIKLKKIFRVTRTIKKIALSFAIFFALISLGIVIDSKINIPNKPNVILIVCEALRPDHIGYHGYKRDTTPHMDSFAENAYVFNNAYCQAPCTVPSMWNIVTSKYQSPVPAENGQVTIAEFFKSHNYLTAAFISQHFLRNERSNLSQGFDVYDAEQFQLGFTQRRATSVTDIFIEWTEQNMNHPFFTWLVYFDPHDPYTPPRKFMNYYNKTEEFSRDRRAEMLHGESQAIPNEHRQFLINAYDEEIRYLDYELGRLFAYLKSSGIYDNSIIIVTADHGEELGDNGNRWDHCQLLSQEEIWIPLLVKMPGQENKIVVEEAVQNIDVYPTLVEYFSGEYQSVYDFNLEGRSLMPLINGEQLNNDRFAASFWRGQRCLIKGNYKYWLWKNKEYLINIKTNENITNSDLLNNLRGQIDNIYKQYILKEAYYKEKIDKLKSLGYIK